MKLDMTVIAYILYTRHNSIGNKFGFVNIN